MEYKDTIKFILDYIDENIKEHLNVEKLADTAAYSTSHFFRLFLLYMGMSPMKYVMKRKLYFAAKELICSKIKIVDITFEYGFESHDVFSRAFKRHYGVTPHIFRKNGYSVNEFYRENYYCVSGFTLPCSLNNYEKGGYVMSKQAEHEVEIVTLPEIKLIGIERKIGGDEWAFDVFYDAYERVFKNAPNRKYPNSENATHALSEMLPDGSYNYFIGVEVTNLDAVPDGAVSRILPPQLCAVVGYEGGLDYREVTDYLYQIWFEQNTYKTGHLQAYPYATVEYYAPNKDSEVYDERIYVPISAMDYSIVEIPVYTGLYVRAVDSEGGKLAKEQAFSAMFKWAAENNLFDGSEVKFEVYYGDAGNERVFCEVFYRTDQDLPMCDGMKRKIYPTRKYFHTSSIHHFLEPNSRAVWRFVQQQNNLSFSDSGAPDSRPYFEEYRLSRAELDMYTPLDLYVCVAEK